MVHRAIAVIVVVASLPCLLYSGSAVAQVESDTQARARPFGLEIADTVKLAGSDARSADFQTNYLPTFENIIDANLSERGSLSDISSMALDPSKLSLSTASDVRVYFVAEGAGYHNTLGFNTEGGGVDSGDPKLIFPDASSSVSALTPTAAAKRSASKPLLAGDFVDLGTMEGGQQLDFFLIANGARRARGTYSTDSSINADGIDHVVAFALADSPYLLIGFEDMYGGGDQDYNDAMFVVDIGAANVAGLPGVPEPATWTVLFSFLAMGSWLHRRRAQRVA